MSKSTTTRTSKSTVSPGTIMYDSKNDDASVLVVSDPETNADNFAVFETMPGDVDRTVANYTSIASPSDSVYEVVYLESLDEGEGRWSIAEVLNDYSRGRRTPSGNLLSGSIPSFDADLYTLSESQLSRTPSV